LPRSKYTKGPGPFLPIDRFVSDVFRFDETARRELKGLLPVEFQQADIPEEIKQLASKLPGTPKPKTLAELIILDTENLISSYPKAKNVIGSRPITPAQVRAAIRKLREALKPFVEGWVDHETAALIPEELDKRLASRELALQDMHIAPDKQGIDYLSQEIGNLLNRNTAELLARLAARRAVEAELRAEGLRPQPAEITEQTRAYLEQHPELYEQALERVSTHELRRSTAQPNNEFQAVFKERDKLKYIVTALDHAGIVHSFSKQNPSRFAARVFPKSNSK
jgi:hypothetical protein